MLALLLASTLLLAPADTLRLPSDTAAVALPAFPTQPFEGLYANDSSTPRLFLIRDGKYVQFRRRSDRSIPVYGYAYEVEDVYDYRVEEGRFAYTYTDTTFHEEGGAVVALTYRGARSPRVRTLRDLLAVNEWDEAALVRHLTNQRGMSAEAIEALLTDPAALDRIATPTAERFTVLDALSD
ncbi:MAG: hypothetical protein AAF624_09900 [Bacteroidota bacterium]